MCFWACGVPHTSVQLGRLQNVTSLLLLKNELWGPVSE